MIREKECACENEISTDRVEHPHNQNCSCVTNSASLSKGIITNIKNFSVCHTNTLVTLITKISCNTWRACASLFSINKRFGDSICLWVDTK